MKTWLKGGIILSGIVFILTIISLLLRFIGNGNLADSFAIPLFIGFIIGLLFFGLNMNFEPTLSENIIFTLLSLILYFIIGALIGWLISKFKKPQNIKGVNNINK